MTLENLKRTQKVIGPDSPEMGLKWTEIKVVLSAFWDLMAHFVSIFWPSCVYFDDSVIFLVNISSKSIFCQFLPIFFFLNERIFVSCRNSKVVSRLESSFQLWHSFHPEKCHFTISFNGSFAVPVVLLLDRRLSKASKKSLNHFLPFFHSESTSGRKGCYFLRENCTISGKLFSNSVTMNMTKAKSSKLFIKSFLAFLGL